MCAGPLARLTRIALFISLTASSFFGYAALAQDSIWNLRATYIGSTSINIKWETQDEGVEYLIYAERSDGKPAHQAHTTESSYRFKRLRPDSRYIISVFDGPTVLEIMVRTEDKPEEVEAVTPPPPILTCPTLPPSVEVFGHVAGTQCQRVGAAGVGQTEVLRRGFINAVDIWSYVKGGIHVCFRNTGSLVFLDAAYSPRMIIELNAFERNGMTCGAIDRPGTVALVRAGAPAAPATPADPAAPPAPARQSEPSTGTGPASDAIPLQNCLIKLVETLFLRAEPAGEIIGLVWQYSEVPAFEINGYWYKIEFEGRTGFVSRYHRKVLRGGCG